MGVVGLYRPSSAGPRLSEPRETVAESNRLTMRLMRWISSLLVFVVVACGAGEIEFETYQLGEVTKIATHCAVADPVLAGASADALPQLIQTQPDRVRNVLQESRAELLAAFEAVDAQVAPRNGEVWSGPAGAATIRQTDDLLIVVELNGDALCPTAPTSWNGVPLAFFREGYLD